MTELGTRRVTDELQAVLDEHDHVADHVESVRADTGEYPLYTEELGRDHESKRPHVLYPVDPPIFVHVYGDVGEDTMYTGLEPSLDASERDLYERLRQRVLDRSVTRPAPSDDDEFQEYLDELVREVLDVDGSASGLSGTLRRRLLGSEFSVTEDTYERLRYQLLRDIAGLGPIEAVMADTHNEDIHVIGPHECYVDHEVYGMLETNVDFGSIEEFENWIRNMGERMNHPVSDSDPIVDSTLPNGSRINIIYSDDVSIKGPSLTIRQGEEVPLSILQITKWGTLSPELAAYLWLCMENEQTVFVVGETASGKTTTLNAMFSFIPRDVKIYTAEDTAEVMPPHDNWQQLLTREGQGDSASDVDMFDLVAAALRSRPGYICVGEVRGAEAQMAFQAAQTGHPILITFHASDIVSMIQRFTSNPINIPETFMDNADVALFQNRVKQGDDILRRVTSVQEIEGYSEHEGGVITREAFEWDPRSDDVVFKGQNNSYVLEEQIATLLGYRDTREIYDELDRRAEIVRRLIEADVLGYHEVNRAIETFQRDGVEGLPIDIGGLATTTVPGA
ncbi:type II/IV secretion system ATPase subunit [Natronomonas marina]|jgi:flagellar protein FlaI|uniref:type II/IV secretion system ATPase subunit n=1 Tax=Natronomonas marina TaxID=2961939 RepID=UPI0020C97CA7|nr:type II/IV secretion system ATPase subunit [Natronomonas marina]